MLEFNNDGGLITFRRDGRDHCLGYLLHAPPHGTFDADLGKVDVSPDVAEEHNRVLSACELDGLDKNCQVGQGGLFYLRLHDGKPAIRTWTGDLVTEDVTVRGRAIDFRRHGKAFRGQRQTDGDCFRFRRIA